MVRRLSDGFSYDKLWLKKREKKMCCWSANHHSQGSHQRYERRERSPRVQAQNKHMLIQSKITHNQSYWMNPPPKKGNIYKHILLISMVSKFSFFPIRAKQASIIISQINSHMRHIIISTSFCSHLITFIYSNTYPAFNIFLPHIPLHWAH